MLHLYFKFLMIRVSTEFGQENVGFSSLIAVLDKVNKALEAHRGV